LPGSRRLPMPFHGVNPLFFPPFASWSFRQIETTRLAVIPSVTYGRRSTTCRTPQRAHDVLFSCFPKLKISLQKYSSSFFCFVCICLRAFGVIEDQRVDIARRSKWRTSSVPRAGVASGQFAARLSESCESPVAPAFITLRQLNCMRSVSSTDRASSCSLFCTAVMSRPVIVLRAASRCEGGGVRSAVR